ncbi:MAG: L,D-transpeptidase family protein [Hydrotalea sp.]|nr:L,D-transpeptidase family protein [Hydrotalea sp.]
MTDNNQSTTNQILRVTPLALKPLAIGRGGMGVKRAEGDGITPLGDFAITAIMYRADRVAAPQTTLPCRAIAPDDIWVDDANSTDYNKLLSARHYPLSHEKLWRDDHLYDLLAVLDYNMNPIVAGRGSAIFIHLARDMGNGEFAKTEGCLAITPADFYNLAKTATAASRLHIGNDGIYLINS